MGSALSSFNRSSVGEHIVKVSGLKLSSYYNPSVSDQAVKKGYFASIRSCDLVHPIFAEYDIRFKKINSDAIVFDGPTVDSPPFTNEQFNNTVCEISFSGRCRLEVGERGYDLVDVSCNDHKKLIHVMFHEDLSCAHEPNRYYLYYWIHEKPTN